MILRASVVTVVFSFLVFLGLDNKNNDDMNRAKEDPSPYGAFKRAILGEEDDTLLEAAKQAEAMAKSKDQKEKGWIDWYEDESDKDEATVEVEDDEDVEDESEDEEASNNYILSPLAYIFGAEGLDLGSTLLATAVVWAIQWFFSRERDEEEEKPSEKIDNSKPVSKEDEMRTDEFEAEADYINYHRGDGNLSNSGNKEKIVQIRRNNSNLSNHSNRSYSGAYDVSPSIDLTQEQLVLLKDAQQQQQAVEDQQTSYSTPVAAKEKGDNRIFKIRKDISQDLLQKHLADTRSDLNIITEIRQQDFKSNSVPMFRNEFPL